MRSRFVGALALGAVVSLPHVVAAQSAPDKQPSRSIVAVRGEGATIDAAVSEPADAMPAPVATPAPVPAPPLAPPVLPPDDERSSQRTWAIVFGAAGLAATGVGLGFGSSASSKWSEAQAACPNNRCTSPADQKLGDDAATAADVATALVLAGSIGIIAGAVMWLTAPSIGSGRALRVAPRVGSSTLGLVVGGAL